MSQSDGPAVVSDYPLFHCGIRNKGNTCFMNVSLQILSRVRRFAQWFRNKEYCNLKDWDTRPSHVVKMSDQIQDMMDALRSPDTNLVTPNGFQSAFVESAVAENMGWLIQGQNDAQEFMSMILNLLHKGGSQNILHYSQIRDAIERKYPDVMTSSTPDIRKTLDLMSETDWWNHYGKEIHPVITNLFHGQTLTIISSRETDERSFRFEPFTSLDLAVPEFDSGCITLRDCLDSHFANEAMTDDSKWNSPTAGKVNAIRASRIWKLPDILVFSIKRCSNTGQKINTKVAYTLDPLDMTPYCTGPAKEAFKDNRFVLTGIVIHVGMMFGGHYYCFVRNPGGQWMAMNDAHSDCVSPDQVIDGVGVYMMVYQRESVLLQDDSDDLEWYRIWKQEMIEKKKREKEEAANKTQVSEKSSDLEVFSFENDPALSSGLVPSAQAVETMKRLTQSETAIEALTTPFPGDFPNYIGGS